MDVDLDFTRHGAERDDWPAIQRRVPAADILLLGTPIWLGAKRAGAIPAQGNQRSARDAGARFDHPDPEYR